MSGGDIAGIIAASGFVLLVLFIGVPLLYEKLMTAIEKGTPYGLAPVQALIANGGRAPA